MPGMVGFTRRVFSEEAEQQTLCRMRDLMAHCEFYVRDEIFCKGSVCATRIHNNTIQKTPQPYSKNDVYVWMQGEFYNQAEILPLCRDKMPEDAAILHQLYSQEKDFSFLSRLDSNFTAVIYDSKKELVHLLTDRYGFSFLYWTVCKGELVWASEVKAFLGFTDFQPTIDGQSVKDFIYNISLSGNRTWFEGVQMVSPATVLTWDIRQKKLSEFKYWSFSDIKMMTGKIDEDEIAGELARLFVDSVDRRVRPGERVGLTLSGGLDSRLILAAFPQRAQPVHAITFGKQGCDDIRIAAKAVKVKGGIHHLAYISGQNWLEPRINAVWYIDGQGNLLHLHRTAITGIERDIYDINLNGLAGDLVAGYSVVAAPGFDFYGIVENRVRRFTQSGTRLGEIFICDRIPFFDKKFFDFVSSIPGRLKTEWHIYTKMLLKTFPDFYRKIPWQKTGHTIRWPYRIMKAYGYVREGKARIIRTVLNKIGLVSRDSRGYTDYPNWIRQQPARLFFEEMLMNSSSLSTQYVSKNHLLEQWDCHMYGFDRADILCRYLTFEIWLRQVFESKHRPVHF